MPSLRNSSCNAPSFRQTGDRFIPDRSPMDFDVAHYLLTQPRKEKEKNEVVSPAKEAYRKILAQTFSTTEAGFWYSAKDLRRPLKGCSLRCMILLLPTKARLPEPKDTSPSQQTGH
ncbi:hypothetical protein HPP92_015429 [Vanilla planifolia]|uniref:Uncharacterized protein n=1 Tax=Vanilla planifolia TaxID=51239 RepID=A0A835QWG1_VANPL|nr:hypothetical protein HPP92_015429 [Vanilla planifolia]